MYRAVAGVVAAAAVGAGAYVTYQKENERLVLEQIRLLMEQESAESKTGPVMTVAAPPDENSNQSKHCSPVK